MVRPRTILVIDDDYAMIELLTSLLSDEGYVVRAAPDGPSGLLALSEATPGMVLLDWMMPFMRGDEVLRRIRESANATVPVVVLSANADGRTLLAQGADAFLAKPFDLDELLDCVAHYIPAP